MRIVAGQWRARQIVTPKGTTTRPTSDRVREALFSSLTSLLGTWDGIRVLDAFAGSGALGLEALSRGAEYAVFVERDRNALQALRRNIEVFDASSLSVVVPGQIEHALRHPQLVTPVSLLLLDPPYRIDKAKVRGLIDTLIKHGTLAEGAIVVWEHASTDTVEFPHGLHVHVSRTYGTTAIDIAIMMGSEEDR